MFKFIKKLFKPKTIHQTCIGRAALRIDTVKLNGTQESRWQDLMIFEEYQYINSKKKLINIYADTGYGRVFFSVTHYLQSGNLVLSETYLIKYVK